MIVYSMVSYGKLRMRLRGVAAEEEAGRIYRTECVETAFVCGLFCPRIYLPLALGEEEKAYILLHEQIHIRRGDQIWRALSYLALCIHWFNPLVWIAFYLSGKDMEMSCDEAVIRKMGSGVRKDYSASLLSLACGRRGMLQGKPQREKASSRREKTLSQRAGDFPLACRIRLSAPWPLWRKNPHRKRDI